MAELALAVDLRASDGLPVAVHGAPGRKPGIGSASMSRC